MLRAPVRMVMLLLALLSGGTAAAADDPPAGPSSPVPASGEDIRELLLRADTLLPLRLLETIGSDTHLRGATFRLVVSDDIAVEGVIVIPAGSEATGQVIHAAKSGVWGKPGELSVTARQVQVGDRIIRLRGLHAATGRSRTDVAMGVEFAIPLASLFVRGKAIVVPAETELIARIAADEAFLVSAADQGSMNRGAEP